MSSIGFVAEQRIQLKSVSISPQRNVAVHFSARSALQGGSTATS